MLDLSNPGTRTWIKGVIRTNMIEAAGASGWMNDFGEALPFDAKLHGGADPAVWHNRYPEEWQQVNREAIEESGHGDEMLCFSRSGYTKSPGIATMFWLGDQLMSWDEYDGIKTALVGILSGGVSGYSMMHSDVGGYVVLKAKICGKALPVINRTPQLFQRWAELNAFTALMRTNEGITPDLSLQFNSTPEILSHFARCSRIYKGLARVSEATGRRSGGEGLSALPASLPALSGRPQHARPPLSVSAWAGSAGRAGARQGRRVGRRVFPAGRPVDGSLDRCAGGQAGAAGAKCQRRSASRRCSCGRAARSTTRSSPASKAKGC